MNTNSNIYTVIYTTVVCVLVAAILAFVSQTLKPKQEANEKAETISQILTAAGFGDKSEWESKKNEEILSFYKENICKAFTVNALGEKIEGGDLNVETATVYTVSDLKKNNYKIRNDEDRALPLYHFKNGVTVIPVYGAGLWGPVWGYIAFEKDLKTIVGAYFDHESETPGLGGKIKDDPSFREQFKGKNISFQSEVAFAIVKGGAPEGVGNAVDAITGATMTSKGLDAAINTWLQAYKPVLDANCCCEGECCEGECCKENNNETNE